MEVLAFEVVVPEDCEVVLDIVVVAVRAED